MHHFSSSPQNLWGAVLIEGTLVGNTHAGHTWLYDMALSGFMQIYCYICECHTNVMVYAMFVLWGFFYSRTISYMFDSFWQALRTEIKCFEHFSQIFGCDEVYNGSVVFSHGQKMLYSIMTHLLWVQTLMISNLRCIVFLSE